MMKRFLCGALATALVVGSVVSAPAASAKKVKVPKAAYTFNMNKANKNVVAVARKGDSAETYKPTEAATKKAKGGIMPTKSKKKVQYKKGKNGKALFLDRTYGVQLKGVNVGSGSWTVSFWIQIPNGIGDFSPVFFAATDLKDASAKWMSITKRSDIAEIGGTPVIWSRCVQGKSDEWPWYCKNGVDEATGEAKWTYGTAFDSKKWVHVTLVVDHSKKKLTEYGEKGGEGYCKGYNGATYINGKLYGNGAVPKKTISSKTKFFLGINGWDVPVRALYDDVTIWKKALTAKQVKQLYKNKGLVK